MESKQGDVVESPRHKGPAGRITAAGILDVIRLQEFRCALTGRPLEPVNASIDHIIPMSQGGLHVLENVQVLHADVNAAKRTMKLEDFIQMCREVVSYADR